MAERLSLAFVLRMPRVLLQLSRLHWLIPGLLAIEDIIASYGSTFKMCSSCFVLLLSYLIIFSIIGVECFAGLKVYRILCVILPMAIM